MTKCLRLALTVITVTATFITTQAQNVAINNTGATAATTAILDASSTTKGILVPRMDKTEKNAIVTPANALLVYQTGPDSVGFHYYDLPNTQWVYLNPSGFANDTTAWKITGNSNTTKANFLGTTNDTALFFRIKNKESGVIDSISAATALGYQSLPNLGNAGQLHNSAFGYKSLLSNTTGSNNTALGSNTLRLHRTGNFNTAVGMLSMQIDTTGFYNTAIGYNALFGNTKGVENVGLGVQTNYYGDSTNYTTAVGTNAAFYNRRNNTTAVGHGALFFNSFGINSAPFISPNLEEGKSNTAVGFQSQYYMNRGSRNTSLGYRSHIGQGFFNPATVRNVAIGDSALAGNFGAGNTAVGSVALGKNNGNQNTAVGDSAMALSDNISSDVAIGTLALSRHTNGGYANTAVGYYSQRDSSKGTFYNTSIGAFSMEFNRIGVYNTGLGLSALRLSDSASYNTAIGADAMYNHRKNASNVAIGAFALRGDSVGYWNTAVGSESMDRIGFDGTARGTGFSNVAVGFRALRGAREAFENTAVGVGALELDSSGNYNTAVGRYSSFTNKRGDFNVSMGFRASNNADTASSTISIGAYAGARNKQDNNVTIGYAAGYNAGVIGGFDPKEMTFVGYEAGRGVWASHKNTALGFRALSNTDAGFGFYDYFPGRNTAIGDSAMAFSIGASNVVVGAEALANSGSSGTWNNVAIGDSAMGAAQSNGGALADNVAIGYRALTQLKNQGNTAIGTYAGQKLSNTIWNTAIGYHALEADTTGSENTVIGTSAFRSNFNGIRNVSLGINTGYWATGSNNTYLGSYAGQGVAARSTGGSNVAVGDFALYAARSSSQNVAIGESALGADSSGNLNVAIGAGAMDQHLRGNENVGIGFWAGRGDTASLNSVYVGSQAGYNNNRSSTVAIGYQALYNNSLGATPAQALNNVAVGSVALTANTLGSSNTAVGNSALSTNSSGNQNTGLGYLSNVSVSSLVNATAIGANAFIAQNNSMVLGSINGVNSATATTSVGIGVNTPGARLHVRRNGLSGGTFIANASMIIEDNAQSYVQLSNPTNSENGILSGNALTSIRSGIVFGVDSTIFLRAGGNTNRMIIDNNGFIGVGTTATYPITQFHLNEPLAADVNFRISSLSGQVPGIELTKGSGNADWKIFNSTGNLLTLARASDDFITVPQNYYEWGITSYRPTQDNVNSLGLGGQRWTTVFATNGTINTSDARDKENVENLNYGIKDLMKLRPVSFTWKENPQWGKKIGFIAQEVQPVLKEVIQIGELKSKKEALNDDGTSSLKETDKLGIYYSDIIPVAVKAIQEQQTQIEKISKENEALKKKNEQLENDIKAIKAKLGIQ